MKPSNPIGQGDSIRIVCMYPFVLNGVEAGGLDPVGVVMQSHVPQHHDGAKQQGRGVGQVCSCYVWGSSMNLQARAKSPLLSSLNMRVTNIVILCVYINML